MKLTLCISSACLVLALACSADTPVSTAISYDPGNPTNQVLLTWEAIPTKQYRVLTTTVLGQPWPVLRPAWRAEANDWGPFRERP